MYVILIAWMYVTLLMAMTESSVVAGVLTFLFYGLLPASLFWWLLGGRRQLQELKRQRAAYRAQSLTDQVPSNSD